MTPFLQYMTWRTNFLIHSFIYNGRYILLDVESGALHEMDKMAYEVVNAVNAGRSPYALSYNKSEVQEIINELKELENGGSYNAEEIIPAGGAGETVIKSMCLHVAHDCNLRCKYCFADTGEFCGERMLMNFETGKKALDFLMEKSGARKHLEVDLFGGEPLMNFDVVKKLVCYGRELEKQYDKHIDFTITTNAVLLNDEMIEFINKEMYNVVISIDGRKEIHDAVRPTINGKGSYDIIVKNAKKLLAGRKNGEHYIRGTFTSNNIDFTNDIISLLDEGFEMLSLEPVVLPSSDPLALGEEHIEKVKAEYDKLAALYEKREAEGRHFTFFHFMIDLSGGPCLKKRLNGCGAGVEYVAITPDGDIYPCHQFVGEKDFCMGSVTTGEYDLSIRKKFEQCNTLTKPECRACWAKYYCSGGCAANAYKYNGDIAKPYKITCEFEKKRTECALGLKLGEERFAQV